jgi:hypothetical protein
MSSNVLSTHESPLVLCKSGECSSTNLGALLQRALENLPTENELRERVEKSPLSKVLKDAPSK